MADLNLKRGDLEPAVRVSLAFSDGSPVPLASVIEIRFRMADVLTRAEIFSRAAQVDGDPALGQVVYVWQPGDTDIAGVYYAEFEVIWPGSRPQTYPPQGYLTVSIEPVL